MNINKTYTDRSQFHGNRVFFIRNLLFCDVMKSNFEHIYSSIISEPKWLIIVFIFIYIIVRIGTTETIDPNERSPSPS